MHQIYNSGFDGSSYHSGYPVVRINLLEGLVSDKVGGGMVSEVRSTVGKNTFPFKIAKILAGIGVVILAVYFIPTILSFMDFGLSGEEVKELNESGLSPVVRNLPPINPLLPKENWLTVSSVGVDTLIGEATLDDYEMALKNGVWRVSDFGQPDKEGAPVILAAHRFGYLAWTNTFRRKSSFYNLPKVKIGDVVTVVWQQREYRYGVYKTETAKEITDYTADLILYTCVSLSGDDRIFVYAKLVS